MMALSYNVGGSGVDGWGLRGDTISAFVTLPFQENLVIVLRINLLYIMCTVVL